MLRCKREGLRGRKGQLYFSLGFSVAFKKQS
jgi:hypothetical protein